MNGTLYIVATPIGNMEDITLRALRVLGEVDVIYCEDTRVTGKLLKRHEIDTSLKRLDANVENEKAREVIGRLTEGENVAYVSDAGTPAISDPGYRLVSAVRAHAENIEIVSVPGPSALTAALSIAGVPSDSFLFLGFLPHKKGRQTLLKEIAGTERTIVLYESPHRIMKLLGELADYIGEREVAVVREATKMHEDVQTGKAAEVAEYLDKANQARGEFVVIISPSRAK